MSQVIPQWFEEEVKWVGRGDLNDDQWHRLEPLLPAQKPRAGRPGKDHRTVTIGIVRALLGGTSRSSTALGVL